MSWSRKQAGRSIPASDISVKAENERGRPPAGQRDVGDIAAVMLVAGQLYIENKSASFTAAVPAALIASVPWDKPSAKLPH
jgi:hypothetical protein